MTIVSKDLIRLRARRDFFAGRSRDSHAMNPGALALVDWLAEFDRLTAERNNDLSIESFRAARAAKALPPLHSAPPVAARIGLRQVAV